MISFGSIQSFCQLYHETFRCIKENSYKDASKDQNLSLSEIIIPAISDSVLLKALRKTSSLSTFFNLCKGIGTKLGFFFQSKTSFSLKCSIQI